MSTVEINFVFNSQNTYYNDFFDEIRQKMVNNDKLDTFEEDYLIYSKDEMNILIDESGTVYISINNFDTNNINQLILDAMAEYKTLSNIDNRFSYENPVKVILPKNNFYENLFTKIKYPFLTSNLDNNVALTMSLDK